MQNIMINSHPKKLHSDLLFIIGYVSVKHSVRDIESNDASHARIFLT